MYSKRQLKELVAPEIIESLDALIEKERYQKVLRHVADILPNEDAMKEAVTEFWKDEKVRKKKMKENEDKK